MRPRELIAQMIRAEHLGEGDEASHPPGKYVSMSSACHDSATECFEKTMARNEMPGYESDYVPEIFRWRGNALAQASMRRLGAIHGRHFELRLEMPLNHGWKGVGHPDWQGVIDDRLVTLEHKDHSYITKLKKIKAWTQGSAYSQIAKHFYAGRTIHPEEWAVKLYGAEPLYVPQSVELDGVVVVITSAENDVVREPLDVMEIDLVAYLQDKMNTVAETCEKNDRTIVETWDKEHGLDLLPDHDLISNAIVWTRSQHRMKEAEAEKKVASAVLMKHLNGVGEIDLPDGAVVRLGSMSAAHCKQCSAVTRKGFEYAEVRGLDVALFEKRMKDSASQAIDDLLGSGA